MNRITEITDFLAPELDVYARLSEVQLLNREFPEKGLFIAESPNLINPPDTLIFKCEMMSGGLILSEA